MEGRQFEMKGKGCQETAKAFFPVELISLLATFALHFKLSSFHYQLSESHNFLYIYEYKPFAVKLLSCYSYPYSGHNCLFLNVSGFLWVLWFTPPIKLTATI
jgi:hypothetical protein